MNFVKKQKAVKIIRKLPAEVYLLKQIKGDDDSQQTLKYLLSKTPDIESWRSNYPFPQSPITWLSKTIIYYPFLFLCLYTGMQMVQTRKWRASENVLILEVYNFPISFILEVEFYHIQ